MDKKEIIKQFEKMGIQSEENKDYTDPYTFAEQLKEKHKQTEDVVCYSNTTTLPQYNSL